MSTRETKKLATESTEPGSPPGGDEPLEATQVRLDDGGVALREKIRVTLIDRPFAMQSSIAPRPGWVPGILT